MSDRVDEYQASILVSLCRVIKRNKGVGGGGHDDPPRARAVGLLVVTIASEPLKQPSFAQPSQKLQALLWPSAAWGMLAISGKAASS
jgi:hypothetical protein